MAMNESAYLLFFFSIGICIMMCVCVCVCMNAYVQTQSEMGGKGTRGLRALR